MSASETTPIAQLSFRLCGSPFPAFESASRASNSPTVLHDEPPDVLVSEPGTILDTRVLPMVKSVVPALRLTVVTDSSPRMTFEAIQLCDRYAPLTLVARGKLRAGREEIAVALQSRYDGPFAVGFPLHLTSVSTGRELRHFGSESAEFNLTSPWSRKVLLATGERGSAWVARPDRLRFEQWTTAGHHIGTIEGTPKWFPRVKSIPEFGSEPATRMKQFEFDSAGRLWVMSWIAGRDWRRAVESAEATPDGERLIDTRLYFDTRVDVFDLRNKQYLGFHRWDFDKMRFINRGGEVLIQVVERAAARDASLALYRLEIHAQPGR